MRIVKIYLYHRKTIIYIYIFTCFIQILLKVEERKRKFLTIIKTLNHHLGTLATMMMRSATTPDFRGNITSIHPHNTPGACRASFGGTLSNGSIITPFLSRITITERVFHHPCRRLRCRARKFTKSLS